MESDSTSLCRVFVGLVRPDVECTRGLSMALELG